MTNTFGIPAEAAHRLLGEFLDYQAKKCAQIEVLLYQTPQHSDTLMARWSAHTPVARVHMYTAPGFESSIERIIATSALYA